MTLLVFVCMLVRFVLWSSLFHASTRLRVCVFVCALATFWSPAIVLCESVPFALLRMGSGCIPAGLSELCGDLLVRILLRINTQIVVGIDEEHIQPTSRCVASFCRIHPSATTMTPTVLGIERQHIIHVTLCSKFLSNSSVLPGLNEWVRGWRSCEGARINHSKLQQSRRTYHSSHI